MRGGIKITFILWHYNWQFLTSIVIKRHSYLYSTRKIKCINSRVPELFLKFFHYLLKFIFFKTKKSCKYIFLPLAKIFKIFFINFLSALFYFVNWLWFFQSPTNCVYLVILRISLQISFIQNKFSIVEFQVFHLNYPLNFRLNQCHYKYYMYQAILSVNLKFCMFSNFFIFVIIL